MARLFSPLKVGDCDLEHRVVLAPLTRYRSEGHVPQPRVATYYEQRASKGGLLITEGTFISEEAGGFPSVPGVWSEEQIEAWKPVTKAVHSKGGFIFVQLWAIGRANTGSKDVSRVVSSGNLIIEDGQHKAPEPLTVDEIRGYVESYKKAAINAVTAGFDGVELHGANGYLIHQFIDASCNNRPASDPYGGSIENRARFLFDILDATTQAIGQEKVALRLSPYTTFQQMGHEPTETYLWICREIKRKYPKLAYIHIVEDNDVWRGMETSEPRGNDPFRAIWRTTTTPKEVTKMPKLDASKKTQAAFEEPTPDSPTAYISCSGYVRETALDVCEQKGDLIAVGRYFISNPDLPERWRNDWPLTPYNRPTFYLPNSDVGYIDYAVHGQRRHGEEVLEQKKKEQQANL